MKVVSFDIETTGLHNYEHEIRSWSMYDGIEVQHMATATTEDGEWLVSPSEVLLAIEWAVSELPAGTTLVSWNGGEFDLPFLHRRFAENGVAASLTLRPCGLMGKYGKPVYDARWGDKTHVDISDSYEEFCKSRHIRWSLKETAKAVLGAKPVEVDARGENIEVMDNESLLEYNDSDAYITYDLAQVVFEDGPVQ